MMFFVQFEATPRRGKSESSEIAGAIVDCWIQAESIDDAVEEARSYVIGEGWIVDDPDNAYEDKREYYKDDSIHLQYFEQALVDGSVFVFHTWPTDEIEAQSDE